MDVCDDGLSEYFKSLHLYCGLLVLGNTADYVKAALNIIYGAIWHTDI